MNYSPDHLKRLLDSVRSIGWFARIFRWREIRDQLIDAHADLQAIMAQADRQHDQIFDAESRYDQSLNDLALARQSADLTQDRKNELDVALAESKRDLDNVRQSAEELKKQHIQLARDEEFRRNEHAQGMSSLRELQEQIQRERTAELEKTNKLEIDRLRMLKDTWVNHQLQVRQRIQALAMKHSIPIAAQVPFKGDPDNTLEISNEYIVFDAKSPGGDDLSHFPHYLKDQAEKAKKYAQQESVRPDIFFVVPSNTLQQLEHFVYRHGDHTVFIISADALEPVMLCLKEIEKYEFPDQLSPEDRQQICRVIGRFAHLSKRKIQVDSFFARQFLDLAYKCEADLPSDILASVLEFERSEKLNPPQEKRAKSISLPELQAQTKMLSDQLEHRGIPVENDNLSNRLNEMPLYKNEPDR